MNPKPLDAEPSVAERSMTEVEAENQRPNRDAEGKPISVSGNLFDVTDAREMERALRESETRYRLLADNVLDLVAQCTPDGRIEYVSPSGETVLGYSPEELLGHPWNRVVVSDKAFGLRREIVRLRRQDGGIITAELLTKSGKRIWAESVVRFRRQGDRIAEIHIATRDITERKLFQDRLARQAEILAAVRDAVIVTDFDEIVWYWNDGATRLFGWTAAETVGRPASRFYPDAMRTEIRTKLAAKSFGDELHGEWEAARKDGKRIWIDAHLRPYTDSQGKTVGLIGLAYDISDRKRAEADLRRQNEHLQNLHRLLDQTGRIAQVGGWEFDIVNQNLMWSDEVFRIHEVSLDYQPTVERGIEFYASEARPVIAEAVERAIQFGEEWDLELPFITATGRHIWVRAQGEAVLRDGVCVRLVGTFQDITERKEVELERDRFFELSVDLLAIAGPDAYFKRVNPAFERVLGYSDEELYAVPFFEFVHPDDLAATRMAMDKLRQGEDLVNFENRYRCRDGVIRWLSWNARAPRTETDLIYSIARDVTAQKEAETETRKLALIAQKTKNAVILTDTARRIEWVNEGFTRITGYRFDEVVGKCPGTMLQGPATDPATVAFMREKLDAGEGFRTEVLNYTKGGDMYWLEIEVTPQFDDGRLTHFMAIESDITQRKQAEQALRDSERRLRRITDHLPTAIAKLDTNLHYLFANPAYLRLVGTTYGSVIGRSKKDVVGEVAFEQTRDRIAKVLRGWPVMFEEEIEYAGGKRWVSAEYVPDFGDRGESRAFYVFITDITDRKHLEEQFRQSQKMEAVGKLAGGIAHDFNNLLTIINGYSQMLLRGLPKESAAYTRLEQIRLAGERGAALTRQLLAFSRKQVLVPRSVDLNTIVTDLDHMVRRLIGEDIELSLDLEGELWLVKADPGQLEQVIVNLIVNARDAMPTGGTLRIETTNVELDQEFVSRRPYFKLGQYARLAIQDTGIGMDEGTRRRIFEPFFTTKEAGKGTGLGLATVYGIVKQSGGYIEVESAVNEGTTFEIYFPRLGTHSQEDEIAEIPKLPALHGSERLMVVEDEATLRDLLRQALEDHGYIVFEAADGAAALEQVTRMTAPLDLLLTDVVMPGISGRELAERVGEAMPDIKVLFMSGYTSDAFTDRGIDEASLALIHKPFAFDDLLLRIRLLLDHISD